MGSAFTKCCSCSKCTRGEGSSTNQPSVTEELRIILLGKTGNGKSSLGNTLVSNNSAFKTGNQVTSVTERCKCMKYAFDNKTRLLSVVDTPGFFDTQNNNQPQHNHSEIARALLLSGNGPHAFFIVLQCARFTLEEKQAIEWMDKIFPGYMNYSIIIFTNTDRLTKGQKLDDYLGLNPRNAANTNKDLINVINKCGRRYYGVNNLNKKKQYVTRVLMDLTEKIRVMLIHNNAQYYRSEIVTSISIAYQKNMEVFQLSQINDEDVRDLPDEITGIIANAISAQQ